MSECKEKEGRKQLKEPLEDEEENQIHSEVFF